ncbi:MAG: S8 family peptidase [Patescibacteria group bacterium]|nr:S8 family peptidase [Patescibacteria group bacterium]
MKNKNILKLIIFMTLFSLGNFCLAAELVPNDSDYSKQWYLSDLQMPKVWGQETGSGSVIVAVIDSGVDISHPDLHDNIWVNQKEIANDGIDNDHNGYIDDLNGWDFIENNNNPTPKFGENCLAASTCTKEAILHGTLIAGVIGAVGNNGFGTVGLAWTVKIMPLRVLNENGAGDTSDVVRAVNYAIDNGASIINLSFVGDTYDASLEKAVERAYINNILVIAAAGNESSFGHSINLDSIKMYPVCFQGTNGENIVLGVGASDKNDRLANFSNFGSSCIDVIAPGEDFWGTLLFDANNASFSAYFGGGYSGTSLAAPVVSGLAALIKSFKPSLNGQEIMDLILNNADNLDANSPQFAGEMGHGLINPVKIFQALNVVPVANPLIKGSQDTVYYHGADGKRYAFPDKQTYLSWYLDFSGVQKISDASLAEIPFGGVVNLKPGSLVKIATDPKVYAVSRGGVLRWVKSEDLALSIFGSAWQNKVKDVPDSFFANYQSGAPIDSSAAYDLAAEIAGATSIDADKGLFSAANLN